MNFGGMEDMEMPDNMPNIDIVDQIDVRQIRGLGEDFMPTRNQTGGF